MLDTAGDENGIPEARRNVGVDLTLSYYGDGIPAGLSNLAQVPIVHGAAVCVQND